VTFDPATRAVRIELAAATPDTPVARLRIEQPPPSSRPGASTGDGAGFGPYRPTRSYAIERDAFVIPLGRAQTIVDLSMR